MGIRVAPGVVKLGRRKYRVFWQEKATGKTASKVLNDVSRQDAIAYREAQKTDQNRGTYVAPAGTTVAEWFDFWIERRKTMGGKRGNNRPSTQERYESLLGASSLRTLLGPIRLQDLTSDDLEAYYIWCVKYEPNGRGGLISAETVHKRHTVIRLALETAVKKRKMPFNPADYADTPAVEKPEGQVFTMRDCEVISAALHGHWLQPIFLTALATGARLAEVLGLERSDVRFPESGRATIAISGHISETRRHGVRREPWAKSKHSRRRLVAPMPLTVLLREHMREQARRRLEYGYGRPDPDLVFATTSETARRPSKVSSLFSSVVDLLEECGELSTLGATFHTIRHTHLTWLREDAEIALEKLRDRAGHADLKTTERYVHFGDHDEEAAVGFELVLESANAAIDSFSTFRNEEAAPEGAAKPALSR